MAAGTGIDPPAEEGLGRRSVAGLKWTYGATGLGLVMQLVYTAVMGRLLSDRAYGLIATAMVALRFGQYMSEMGLGPALVQRRELSEEDVRASFTSSILLSSVLAAVVIAIAPYVAGTLLQTPDAGPVLQLMAIGLVLTGSGLTAQALALRQLRFREVALIDVGAFFIGYLVVGITSAVLGAGVYSLVAATLTQQGLVALGCYLVIRHPLRPVLALRRLGSLYAFGGKVSVISLLESITGTITSAAIVRVAGERPLGQFNRSSLLIGLPLQHMSTSLSRVMFPTISRIQDQRARIGEVYLLNIRVTGALLVPVAAGLAVAADETVRVLLGEGWDQAADVLPVLAFGGVMTGLNHFAGVIAEALDLLNRKLALQVLFIGTLVAALLLNRGGSLIGFGVAVAAAELAGAIGYALLLGSALGVGLRRQVQALVPSLLAGALVAGAIAGYSVLARSADLPLAAIFVGQVAVGMVTLLLLVWFGPLRRARDLLVDRLRSAGVGEQQGKGASVLALLEVGRTR